MPRKPPAKSLADPSEETLTTLALAALREVTGEGTYSLTPTFTKEEGVLSAHFPSTMEGSPGWSWTVALGHSEGQEPTVLEVELIPGEKALLSPAWVPWADRMEEYLLHEKELKDAAAVDDDDDDDDGDDDDFDDDDVDGVDIDQLDIGLDPAPLEVPEEPTDVFDRIEWEEPETPNP